MSRFSYFEQCDRFRTNVEDGEAAWQEMMASRRAVSMTDFEAACDASGLLDEGEDLAGFMAESADPDAALYEAQMRGVPCYFVQSRGFEFIFLRPSDHPRFVRHEPRKRRVL